MKKAQWGAAWRTVAQLLGQTAQEEWADDGLSPRWRRAGWWQGLAGRSPEIMEIEEEVAAEQRGRLVLVSRHGALPSWLLARLRQQAVMPMTNSIEREGFFTLIQLPPLDRGDQAHVWTAAEAAGVDDTELALEHPALSATGTWRASTYDSYRWSAHDRTDMVLEAATEADILLYLFDQQAGWQEADACWYARLRVLGTPLLPVMLCTAGETVPHDTAAQEEVCQALHRALGVRPAVLDAHAAGWRDKGVAETTAPPPMDKPFAGAQPAPDLFALLQRILSLRPRLALPLAQEAPWCRSLIAVRVIRSGAMMAMVVGAEPIPLLDLPLQLAIQWKVALQLAAIYGRPGLDYRSREMVGTLLLNLCVRQLAQQALKVIPFIGWLLSGTLSGVSTWLLGAALRRYYEQEQLWDWQGVQQRVGAWRRPRQEDRKQEDSEQTDGGHDH